MPQGGSPSFWLRLGEKILPGTQIGSDGQSQNIGRGVAGLAAKFGASFLGGPLAGMAAGKLIGKAVDSNFARPTGGNQLGFGSPQQPFHFQGHDAWNSPGGWSSLGQSPYSRQFQSGYQLPSGGTPSIFAPQQSIWSFQGDPYAKPPATTPPPNAPPAQGSGGGGDLGFGGGGRECVTVDSFVVSERGVIRAGDVKVGDKLLVVDPTTLERSWANVSYSETRPQPCVTIEAGGVQLDCSETAPIANIEGLQVKAPDLYGQFIPLVIDGKNAVGAGQRPVSIGVRDVQHITCESKFFLAGKVEGRYFLHHNIKGDGGTTPTQGPVSSYNYMPNSAGLKWGWGWD